MDTSSVAKPHYEINDTKNVHLLEERQSATFNVEEFTQFMFGQSDNYYEINTRRKIIRLALAHPIHRTHLPFEYLNADEHYSLVIRKSLLAIEEAKHLKITNDKHRQWFFYIFSSGRFAFYIHDVMCTYAIETMSNEEQKRKFLPLAKSYRITTAYTQTELGHGTDLRRLETEAVFDRETDSFVLNTPTLTSTKFWPGALARSSNYALLMAHLYAPDRNHPCGNQMFLVQLRDLDTHELLPGVETGSISTRFNDCAGDNGYLRLTNVRVPRTNMLMKAAEVDRNGNFQRCGDARVLYGAMIHMRIHLSYSFAVSLAQAITIATRYSAVRFQGSNPQGKETRILDYPLQQEKLVPCLASAYAFLVTFLSLNNYFNNLKTNETVFFRQLPELHALAAGLKAYTSSVGERLAQNCRVSCGGHGFLFASGIIGIRNFLDASTSAEGDTVVLYQQTARYILKMIQRVEEDSDKGLDASIAYLRAKVWSGKTMINLEDYCHLFESRAQLLAKEALALMFESSLSPYATFLKNSIQLVQLAKAHMETYIMRSFLEQVNKAAHHPKFSVILEQLFYVFAIHTLRNESKDFIRLNLLTAEQIYELENRLLPDLYTRLRPNLVPLVDAFDFHDVELDSCLGRYDGQAYQALMERARLNPANQEKVPPIWKAIKQGALSKL
uniref:Acyl-coenzyme A oxidase n=1 Tax=Hordeum vulgare subsp. vulgare TaxID=112509 RepID=F2E3T4_HORVV|nr:predicted protein [Hordeum vulgare subsp. vulgare]